MQSQLILKRNDITFFLFLDSLSHLPVDATFKFYKVGKASPSLEFNTIMHFSKNVHLLELKKLLINQHIKGIDLNKKFPTYDMTILRKSIFTHLIQRTVCSYTMNSPVL